MARRAGSRNAPVPAAGLISADNPLSISQQLRRKLLEDIESGALQEGTRIPSERELAESYRISRTSVREAIAQLLAAGVLIRGGGRGTFVSEARAAPHEVSSSANPALRKPIGFWISDRIFGYVQEGYSRILTGASEACHEGGYGLQFLPIDDRRIRELRERAPLSDQFEGSILVGGASQEAVSALQESGLPLIMVDLLTNIGPPESLRIDYQAGARAALDHLIAFGHREIGFIGFPHSQKYEAYWQRIEQAGLRYHPRFVEFLEPANLMTSTLAGFTAMRSILDRSPLPTAVLVTNDLVAIGAIDALRQAGISVPEGMSIVGFDDLADSPVPLTTVRVDLYEIGRAAARTLIQAIESGERHFGPTIFPVDLIIRGSTAPPRSA